MTNGEIITESACELGIRFEFLDKKAAEKMNELMVKKFTCLRGYSTGSMFYWEDFTSCTSVPGEFAYEYISDYTGDSECFLLEPTEGIAARFGSGHDLVTLWEEHDAYELYVSDRELTYLFCFCHEDVLFACGEAEKWLERKSAENGREFFGS